MVNKTIANQILESQDKNGMLRRALERIIQLYTDKSHFVYELLQNAEDAGATKIKFLQDSDKLVVLHDGRPFSLSNLRGLCDIGKSDKINDLNQIGEFGVGFKSVFGICETVEVYSHPGEKDYQRLYQFYESMGKTAVDIKAEHPAFAIKILDFTHPEGIEDQDMEPGYTTKFVFNYSVGFTFSGFETIDNLNEVLSKRLQNLGITTLLFMKNLQTIDYQIELPMLKASGAYSLDKKVINDHCSLVSAVGEDLSYLVFSRAVKGVHAGRTIDIAFSLNVAEDGKYSFKPSKYPYISVYFPTETESKLKFIVQGPYRTTPNRSSVPSDNQDNIELARQTVQLLRDSVIELRDTGRLDFSFLDILPINNEVFYSSPLFKGMFEEIIDMMPKERLLLCKDGTYASSECVKIARGSDLAELFTDELLTELLDKDKDYHWLPTYMTGANKTYSALYAFLTNTLKIEVIRPEDLRSIFNKNRRFLLNRDNEWLIRLYNMYASVPAEFSKQRGGTNMLTVEFIKTSTGKFMAPYRKSDATYLPNVFQPSKNIDDTVDIAVVDESIFEKCKYFFTEILALQEPNEYEFFIRDFKTRYESMKSFTDEQHIADVKKLLKYRLRADYQEEVDNIIKMYLQLKCVKGSECIYVNPHREAVYFSFSSDNLSIEYYFKNVATFAYVDVSFYNENDISDESLRSLGVQEDIAVGKETTAGEYITDNPGPNPRWNTYGDFRWKLLLKELPRVLEYIASHPEAPDSMAKSSFIFRFLLKNERKLHGTVRVSGDTVPDFRDYATIVKVVRFKAYMPNWNGKWLYTKSMHLVSADEIPKRELNPDFYGDVKPDSDLYNILGFRKSQEDYLEETEKDYDRLSKEQKNKYFEIELQRRYGISVADLENNFGSSVSGGKRGSSSIIQEDAYEFPSSKVKNWDSLRKHAAEVLCFANPTKYECRIRRIRVSKPVREVRAYLMNMYKVDQAYKYACQMCHDPFPNVEACQIANSPEVELDPMNLCLCPNCAAKYRRMRVKEADLCLFWRSIKNLTDDGIVSADPVKLMFADETIWFTQTHIAEIKELMTLQEAADNYRELPGKMAETDQEDVVKKLV